MDIKKPLAVAVILLFFSVSVIPSTGTTDIKQITMPINSGDTLYVGGSGPGNYTRIQDAIDNASDGDTVFVYNGTYYEEVNVNNRINLIGESTYDTIISSLGISDTVLVITSDYVKVKGFTITSRNNSIKTTYGIKISSSCCNISNCNIMDNSWTGIAFYGYSNHNTIYMNNIKNSVYGIYLGFGGRSCFNIIKHNNFIDARPTFTLSFYNRWISNYYKNWLGIGPKIIWGLGFIILWINLDWHPAKEPYDI